jgi:hypothetical protein
VLEHCRGPLPPNSAAPGVIELRERLEETLRQAVMARGAAKTLLMLAERVDEDLELWEAALAALPPEDPRRAAAQARVEQIQKTW